MQWINNAILFLLLNQNIKNLPTDLKHYSTLWSENEVKADSLPFHNTYHHTYERVYPLCNTQSFTSNLLALIPRLNNQSKMPRHKMEWNASMLFYQL